jgi:Zn-dependent peptidase ImmA (M78 family)
VLDTHGDGRIPIPVEPIAEKCGCEIARNGDTASDITSFAIVSASGNRVIGLNTAQGVRSQRFAIAHALAHHQLHEREITVCRQIRALKREPEVVEADDGAEQQANAFALELILPGDLVMDAARNHLAGQANPGRDELVNYLAKLFRAPAMAAAARLVDLAILTP